MTASYHYGIKTSFPCNSSDFVMLFFFFINPVSLLFCLHLPHLFLSVSQGSYHSSSQIILTRQSNMLGRPFVKLHVYTFLLVIYGACWTQEKADSSRTPKSMHFQCEITYFLSSSMSFFESLLLICVRSLFTNSWVLRFFNSFSFFFFKGIFVQHLLENQVDCTKQIFCAHLFCRTQSM